MPTRHRNDNDPEPLVRHIAPDALIVNPLGSVMRGPEEVQASGRQAADSGEPPQMNALYMFVKYEDT